jgi:hypothetical protein
MKTRIQTLSIRRCIHRLKTPQTSEPFEKRRAGNHINRLLIDGFTTA